MWTPGQHVFIRFLTLSLHSLTAHPFSICSMPALPHNNQPSELVFYIRPRGGFTSRLARIAARQPNISLPILLDGPYGGMNATTLAKFDKALIIAGGSGAGYTLPLIEDVARKYEESATTTSEKKEASNPRRKTVIQVLISTRDLDTRIWYHEAIDQLLTRYPAFSSSNSLHVSVYHTGISSTSSPSSDPTSHSPPELPNQTTPPRNNSWYEEASPSPPTTNVQHRPNLPLIIHAATSEHDISSVGIAVCGPASMLQDVRSAAAGAQGRILRSGGSGGGGARDVYLHTEHFS